jgi:hypothetical protein
VEKKFVNMFLCAIAAILAVIAMAQFTTNQDTLVYTAIGSVVVVDLWNRSRDEESESPFLGSDAGSTFWIVPFWITGIVLAILVALSYFRLV